MSFSFMEFIVVHELNCIAVGEFSEMFRENAVLS